MKMRTVLIMAVLAALLGPAAWLGWRWYTTPAPPEVALDGAEPEVVEVVEKALQEVRRQPRSGKTWGNLAMVLDAHNLGEQAAGCYFHAERFDPDNLRWPYLHAVQLLKKNPRQAITRLQRALSLAREQEDRALILFRLAQALIEDGQFAEAAESLQDLGQIEPEGLGEHFGLALLSIAREDRATARDHLRALSDNPFVRKRANALLMGLVDGNKELARACQERAARLPPDLPWPDPYLEQVQRLKVDRMSRIAPFTELEGQGRHQEALNFLRGLAAESPDAAVCFSLGFNLLKINEFEEAAAAFRTAIHFDSRNVQSQFLLGVSLLGSGEKRYQEQGGKDQALDLFRQAVAAEDQALAIQSGLGGAHLTRGRALKRLGNVDEALRALRQGLLCQPESADMHLELGETLAEMGKVGAALPHLENAVRYAGPEDSRPRRALAKWRDKSDARP